MNDDELKSVIRKVIGEVVSRSSLKELMRNESASQASLKPNGRILADENIARWLGKTSTHVSPQTENSKSSVSTNSKHTQSKSKKNLIPKAKKPEKLEALLESTPARLGVWRAGTRYLTRVALKMRADHAVAKDAVYAELKPGFAEANGWISLETKAKTKEEFLLRPDLGRTLSEDSLKTVSEKAIKGPDVQITVSDGLSAWAAERYAKPLIDELTKLLTSAGLSLGTIFFVRYGRIAIQDIIGEAAGAKLSMILLGERPGLGTGDSLSNYMIYGPKIGAINAKKSMISNIHPAGHKPADAAQLTMSMVKKMFEQQCSGIELKV